MLDRTVTLLDAFRVFFPSADSLGSYIHGALVTGEGDPITLEDPATGTQIVSYADAGANLAHRAAEYAQSAQRQWAKRSAADRGRVLWAVAQVVRQHVEALARLESLNAGKPIRDCRVEVAKVAEMFEYYAGWADKFHGDVIPVPSGHLNYVRREPLGVVLQITPWNAPLFTCGWQVAPALAMGNAILLKPSELTPCTSLALAHLAEEAGLPVGLLNVLAGYGQTTGQGALEHVAVQKVVFVGSPGTGRQVATAAAQRLLPSVLELGGKSANIVFDDANLARACEGSLAAIFSAAGQSCVAGSRLFIQRSIYDDFVSQVAKRADAIRVGHPGMDSTEVGPLVSRSQFERVRGMIAAGVSDGVQRLTQSASDCDGGFFIRPTVFAEVTNNSVLAQEEIFGPVLCAIPFDTEDEVIGLANDTRYGLAGAVWTSDPGRAHRMAAQIRAGTFWVNAYKTIHVSSPFGGSGDSGYGRSSGVDALHEYTHTKSVWVETATDTPAVFGYIP